MSRTTRVVIFCTVLAVFLILWTNGLAVEDERYRRYRAEADNALLTRGLADARATVTALSPPSRCGGYC